MARSTRLYTLCVIFLLAYQPPATLAASTSRLERVSIAQLERRQGLEGIFGGRGNTGDSTTDTTADTTSPLVTGTTGGSVNPTQATSVLSSSPLSSPTGVRIPLFGTSTASGTSTEPVGVSLSIAICKYLPSFLNQFIHSAGKVGSRGKALKDRRGLSSAADSAIRTRREEVSEGKGVRAQVEKL